MEKYLYLTNCYLLEAKQLPYWTPIYKLIFEDCLKQITMISSWLSKFKDTSRSCLDLFKAEFQLLLNTDETENVIDSQCHCKWKFYHKRKKQTRSEVLCHR